MWGARKDNASDLGRQRLALAKSREELMEMQTEVTISLEDRKLWWKPSSLTVMTTGDKEGDMVTTGAKGMHTHKEVERMVVLGTALDRKGTTEASVAHREADADIFFIYARSP